MSSFPFSVVVGNPPYQTGKVQVPGLIGTSPINIFQDFQTLSTQIGEVNCLIYPGGRWASQTGNNMKKFGQWLSNYNYVHKIIHWVESRNVFKNAEISGGITIVYIDHRKENKGYWDLKTYYKNKIYEGLIRSPKGKTLSLFPFLNNIVEKVNTKTPNYNSLNTLKQPIFIFGLRSSYAINNPDKVVECSQNFDNMPETGEWVRILVNDKAGKGGRSKWFWAQRDIFSPKSLKVVDKWKVIISSKNTNGLNGRSMQAEILPPNTAHSTVRACIGSFDTEAEAINFFNWLKTDFVRCLLVASGSLLGNFGEKVPLLDSYMTDGNLSIDFSKPETLNKQLFDYYEIDDSLREQASEFVKSLKDFSNFNY